MVRFSAGVINTTSAHVWGVLLLIPTAEKHLRECQEEQGPSEVIEI